MLRILSAIAVLIFAAGCIPATSNGTASTGGSPKPGTRVNMAKVNVGLPVRALGYAGTATILAGAKDGDIVFLGANRDGMTHVHSYDLNTGGSREVFAAKDMQDGSLICSNDGKHVVYTRTRDITHVIDDPSIGFPSKLAVLELVDAATGKEREVFNFNEQELRPYRADQLSPYISLDGTRIITMGYNVEHLMAHSMTTDWLATDADLTDRYGEMTDEERTGTQDYMRALYGQQVMEPFIREAAIDLPEDGEITEEERDFVKDVFEQVKTLHSVLLIWDQGKVSILPVEMPEEDRNSFVYIITAGMKEVILGVQDLGKQAISENNLLRVDMETGKATRFASFAGAPTSISLDETEENLLILLNPYNEQENKWESKTQIIRIPVDGSEQTVIDLPGNYFGYADISINGDKLLAQDRDNADLYLIDTNSGEKHELVRLLAELDGVFLTDDASHAVFIDKQFMYAIDIPKDIANADNLITAEYFAPYEEKLRAFFTQMGFEVPAELDIEWEETNNRNMHEFSAEVRNPDNPDKFAVLRYSVELDTVAAIWFPQGYIFPISEELRGTDVDYYEAEDIVDNVLDRLGWLSTETREIYQPQPEPLYDGPSATWVFLIRDGYWLGEGEDAKWVYNKEVYLRVLQEDGTIPEITYTSLDPVFDQPIAIAPEQAVFLFRNYNPDQPIPEEAPVRFDVENVRYVLVPDHVENWDPAYYASKGETRLCYEMDVYIMPEDVRIYTFQADTEVEKIRAVMESRLPDSMFDEEEN